MEQEAAGRQPVQKTTKGRWETVKDLLKHTAAILLALFIVFYMLSSPALAEESVVLSGISDVHTITFMSDSPAAYLVADGKTLETFPQAPEKQAADFIGWYDGEQEILAPFRPEQDMTLVAKYVEWGVMTLSAEVNGVMITVTGRMPSGCRMSVTDRNETSDAAILKIAPVNSSRSEKEKSEETLLNLYAYDILILKDDTSAYQPEADYPVTVTVTGDKISAALSEGRDLRVTHPLHDGTEEVITDMVIQGNSVSFSMNHVSNFDLDAVWNLKDTRQEPMEGITLTGRMPVGAAASASVIENAVMAVDLSLNYYGREVQPLNWNGRVMVTMHSDAISRVLEDGGSVSVFLCTDQGNEELETTIHEDGSLSVMTDRLAVLAIVRNSTSSTLTKFWTLRSGATLTVYDTEEETNGIQIVAEDHAVFKTICQSSDWTVVEVDGKIKYVRTREALSMELPVTDEHVLQNLRKVQVRSSRGTSIEEGRTVLLTADLSDFADCSEVSVIWEISTDDGWFQAGTGETFEYTVTRESLQWMIRARVVYAP